MTLQQLLTRDPAVLLDLEPDELGFLILEFLVTRWDTNERRTENDRRKLKMGNIFSRTNSLMGDLDDGMYKKVFDALTEAWNALENQNLIARNYESSTNDFLITRAGMEAGRSEAVRLELRAARHLPRQLLHPEIDQQSWPPFLRGEYDTAVFKAYRAVEIRTREAAGLNDSDIGVDLMHDAFKPDVGPLTDSDVGTAEQLALRRMFAGAVGSYKNPHSHRHVKVDPEEAAEMIVLASHLMKIIDARSKE